MEWESKGSGKGSPSGHLGDVEGDVGKVGIGDSVEDVCDGISCQRDEVYGKRE